MKPNRRERRNEAGELEKDVGNPRGRQRERQEEQRRWHEVREEDGDAEAAADPAGEAVVSPSAKAKAAKKVTPEGEPLVLDKAGGLAGALQTGTEARVVGEATLTCRRRAVPWFKLLAQSSLDPR